MHQKTSLSQKSDPSALKDFETLIKNSYAIVVGQFNVFKSAAHDSEEYINAAFLCWSLGKHLMFFTNILKSVSTTDAQKAYCDKVIEHCSSIYFEAEEFAEIQEASLKGFKVTKVLS